MANPAFLQPATYTPRRLLRESQVLARIGSAIDAADFLGSDAGGVERDESLAGILNVCLEEFLRDFPHLGLKSAGLATTAFDPYSDLPTDLHGSDIESIVYNEIGNRHGIRIQAVSSNDIRHLPRGVYRGGYFVEWPSFYAVLFDALTNKWRIRWLPGPSISRSCLVVYRARPQVYSAATINLTTPEVIIPVPDYCIEPLLYLVAERIQARNTGVKSATPEGLREHYEMLRKRMAYIETPIDELLTSAFIPSGQQPQTGAEDKADWNAQNEFYYY